VLFTGLVRNLPLLELIVECAPVDDLDLLDKSELLRCLHKAALGIGISRGVDRLSLTLCVLKWLSLQDRWLRAPQPPARVIRVTRRSTVGEVGASGPVLLAGICDTSRRSRQLLETRKRWTCGGSED